MPFHVPITRVDQLPKPDSDIEREIRDWKAPGAATEKKYTPFHKAKDVAAFANHIGGALIIGACEGSNQHGGKLARWVGMTQVEAQNLANEFTSAVKAKCDPPIDIDPLTLAHDPDDPAQFALVVNVPASLHLVGVKAEVAKDECWDDKNKALVYPVRTAGTATRFLTANELPMYMTPEIRRIAIMLNRIAKHSPVKVPFHRATPSSFQFDSVVEEQNVVKLRGIPGPGLRSIPLDGIVSVYQESDQQQAWWIIVKDDLRNER